MTEGDPSDAEFREAGFTGAAREFPLSDAACAWLAAFNGVKIEQMPRAWRYAPNEWMRDYLEKQAALAAPAH